MDFPPASQYQVPKYANYGAEGYVPPTDVNAAAQQKQQASNKEITNSSKIGRVVQMNPMKFPVDQSDRYSGVMSFQAVKIIPPNISFSSDTLDALSSVFKVSDSESKSKKEIDADPEGAQAVAIQSKAQSNLQQKTQKTEINSMKMEILDGHKVSMYIPTAFVVNDIISYDNAELGVLGATGLQTLQNTGNIAAAASQVIKSGISSVKDMFSAGSSLTGIAARVAVARGADIIPMPEKARNALRSASQVTVNPNVRALFRGVALREFTFQFKLIPTSKQESDEIKRIIKFFRYHAYPESFEVGGVPIAYVFPSLFKIKLKYKNNTIGSRIKLCYLRNISTTYNPTASSFFADGSPTEIDLSLSFVENRTLVRQDIDTGDNQGEYEGADANLLDTGSGF